MIEPLPWPGNPSRPIDDTNRGKYLFEVVDAASGTAALLARLQLDLRRMGNDRRSEGDEPDLLRVAALPGARARRCAIVVKKRDARNVFRDVWTFKLDPADKFIARGAEPPDAGPLIKLHESGDPAKKLDLLILGDGYTARERGKFERDARRLVAVLLATSPFKERRGDINIWGLSPAAAQSGVSRPSQRIYRRSPVGATYDAFDSERYVLTFENKAFRDIAANAPYEVVEILVNSATYGGGGIYGLYSTVAADSVWAGYIFVHEFGHHIAGLADEYYTSDVAYLPAADRVEPWEPNATALLDPAALKWKDLVTPGTPSRRRGRRRSSRRYTKEIQQKRRAIRAANRPEAEMDALFREEEKRDTALLNEGPHAGKVGAFEGANYEARGYFRPQADCIMFTRDNVPFCAVCRRAIDAILDLYTQPVASPRPLARHAGLTPSATIASAYYQHVVRLYAFCCRGRATYRFVVRRFSIVFVVLALSSARVRPDAAHGPGRRPRSHRRHHPRRRNPDSGARGSGSPAPRRPTTQGRFSIVVSEARRLRARDARARLRRHAHQHLDPARLASGRSS